MKSSESVKNLAKALLEAQKNIGSAKKDSKNPFFKSKYADLPTVMEVVKEPLTNAGIVVLQPAFHKDGKNFIVTTLLHAESGEWLESETEVICAKANDPQAFGAAQTYARRFSLQSLLFVPAEDNDAEDAMDRRPAYQQKATQATAAPVAASNTAPTTATETPAAPKTSKYRKPSPTTEAAPKTEDGWM